MKSWEFFLKKISKSGSDFQIGRTVALNVRKGLVWLRAGLGRDDSQRASSLTPPLAHAGNGFLMQLGCLHWDSLDGEVYNCVSEAWILESVVQTQFFESVAYFFSHPSPRALNGVTIWGDASRQHNFGSLKRFSN